MKLFFVFLSLFGYSLTTLFASGEKIPVTHYDYAENYEVVLGRMGCIILAGGQGSRLGSDEPKGFFPVSLIQKKSLFQLFFEKTGAASQQAGRELPLAVMTSPLNHQLTLEFLEDREWFGLSKDRVDLFSQGMLPFLDEEGNWILDASGKPAAGPDGNGGALKAFYESGVWEKWQKQGIEAVQVVLIDNALADPFDAQLCSYHLRQQADITVKCIQREPGERVGVFALDNGKVNIVEYSEMPEEHYNARNPDGSFVFALANTGLMCFDMQFIKKISEDFTVELPWHIQKKKAQIDGQLREIQKCETFIFDLFPFAQNIALLCYPREEIFAPLKNATGNASLHSVQAALLAYDRAVYFRVTGVHPPEERVFELDPQFYYPTSDFLKTWRGRPLPESDYLH